LRNSISVIASRYSDVAIYVFILDCHALRARKDRIISSFVIQSSIRSSFVIIGQYRVVSASRILRPRREFGNSEFANSATLLYEYSKSHSAE
ncbi:MAG: hypothetical protein WAV98_00320, partial [Minisyncoccia bacterium]